MKRARKALTAFLGAAYLLSLTLPANAAPGSKDSRPCVSFAEYVGWVDPYHKKRALEMRWEVRGLGIREPDDLDRTTHGFLVTYPACGYSLDEAWVVIEYDNARNWWAMNRHVEPGATLDGPR